MQTHNVALAAPIAHFIVSLSPDGSVQTQDTELDKAIAHDSNLARQEVDSEVIEIAEQEVTSLAKKKDSGVDGRLIVKEEIAEGHVTWKSIKLFLSGLGGNHPFLFFALWTSGIMLTDWLWTFQVWFLGYWGSQYENHAPSEVSVSL